MALVTSPPLPADATAAQPESDEFEQYKGWREFQEDGKTRVHYKPGDEVICLVNNARANKKTVVRFVCRLEHDANATVNRPPDQTPTASIPVKNNWWGPIGLGEDGDLVDVLPDYEIQFLPNAVGAQLLNDPDPDPRNRAPAAGRDRYVRTGVIMFDGNGALLHDKYSISKDGVLAKLLYPPELNLTTRDIGMNAAFPQAYQLGLALYDATAFKAAGYDDDDPLVNDQTYTPAEANEEKWLDNESLSLMINRYDGTLVRGE
jgi:hypothetical protein